jgi:hypothetical protein
MKDSKRVALLEKDEAKVFYEYATKESTPEEKQELKEDYEFYKGHCKRRDL